MRVTGYGRRVGATLVVAALAVVASGCSNGVERNPKQALANAGGKLGEYAGLTTTMRVVGDVDAIVAASKADGKGFEREDVQTLLDSALTVSVHEGADPEKPEDDEAALLVTVAGSDDIELRVKGKEVYLRADVQHVLGLIDDAPPPGEIELGIVQAEQMGLDFARPAYEGRWLHLLGVDQLQSFAEGLTGQQAPVPDQKKVNEAAARVVGELLRDDVTVTYAGADDVGEKVVATVGVRELVEASLEIAEAADLPNSPLKPDELRAALDQADLGDADIAIQAWISDGVLRRLRLDLVALARTLEPDEPPPSDLGPVEIELDFTEFAGGVEVPADAVDVDLFKVFGQLTGRAGGLGGGGGGGAAGDEPDA
ncbi:MAG: hypothetical protein M3O86_03035, partial [Actinomycetota bacterium]|nr:hypothetical protein [Actinomycetota bacterium]